MKPEKSDRIRTALVASASAIPWAGGPLAVVLDKYLPDELERRKDAFIKQIADDLKQLENKVGELALDSPEMMSTFIKILRHGLEEYRQEKLIAYRNILLNSAISLEAEMNERDFYIRLVDTFTIDQIRILHLLYMRDVKHSLVLGEDNNIYSYVKEAWPSVDEYYIQACVTELMRFFIVSSATKLEKEKGDKGHSLTGFGERFISYIFSPVEMVENHL